MDDLEFIFFWTWGRIEGKPKRLKNGTKDQ